MKEENKGVISKLQAIDKCSIIKKNDCTNINMYFNIFSNIFYKQ